MIALGSQLYSLTDENLPCPDRSRRGSACSGVYYHSEGLHWWIWVSSSEQRGGAAWEIDKESRINILLNNSSAFGERDDNVYDGMPAQKLEFVIDRLWTCLNSGILIGQYPQSAQIITW